MNNEISYDGDNRAYIALGRFISVFANMDFQLTIHLSLMTNLGEQSANVLLQGMRMSVKLQKLKQAAKLADPVFREYAPIYNKFSEYNEFRNKIVHWSHIFEQEGQSFDITDPTRNAQKTLAAHRISVNPDDLVLIAEWIWQSLSFFYPFVSGKKELLPEGYDVERLLRDAPPVPKDRDTSLRTLL